MAPRRPETLARIAARVREEAARVEGVVAAMRDALARWDAGPQDRIHVHWVGGLVHDFYTGLERAFSEVSPELNGHATPREAWHRDLLHVMTLDLPGFRPAVLRPELETRLLEHLKFRHVYRNLYSFELLWDRVRPLAEDAVAIWPDLRSDLESFANALDAMAGA